jgi:hypothetical protein
LYSAWNFLELFHSSFGITLDDIFALLWQHVPQVRLRFDFGFRWCFFLRCPGAGVGSSGASAAGGLPCCVMMRICSNGTTYLSAIA